MTVNPVSSSAPRRFSWKTVLAVLAIVLAVVAVLLAVRVVRAANAARSAMNELQVLQDLDPALITSLDPVILSDLRDRFARLEGDFTTIERQAGPFLPLTRHMSWLPRYSAEAQAAPALLDLAQNVATAGRAGMDGAAVIAEALKAQEAGGSALARLVPALQQTQPSWQEVDEALVAVAAARNQLDLTSLDPRLTHQLQQLDTYLPLLQTGSALARLAPQLLGADGAKTYLVLPQNSDELRPTGGFISGVGLLPLDRGELGEVDFEDSYTIYNDQVDHPLAPADLEATMGAQILLFRDANWSVDFPASAGVAQALYQLDTGHSTDGVIAFDLVATQRLMAGLEPLTLPGYQEPLTTGNVLAALRAVWNEPLTTESTASQSATSDWWLHRKDFMGDLAAAARAKLEAGQVDMGKLAQALYSSLQEKHLLLAMNDPAAQALLDEAGWSGQVRPGDGDYLLVVDSNVGWNKVNSVVQRNTNYTITPNADGSARAQLELVYRHTGQTSTDLCVHVARYGDSYEDMVRRCYFNYIRVLVPDGAKLVQAEGFNEPTASTQRGERNTTQFAGNLTVPPGETRRVLLTYDLPAGLITPNAYHLRIQKQPGIPAWPVRVVVADPAGGWQTAAAGSKPTDAGLLTPVELSRDTDLVWTRP